MSAHFDDAGPAVVIDHLDLRDPAVVTEARRWSTGRRGDAVSTTEMSGADVTAFAVQAFSVGAHAIATAGGAQEAYNLGALVTEVGERTAEASRQAGQVTDEAIRKATETIKTSTAAMRAVIGELGTETRRAFAENVDAAGKVLAGDVNRLFGGEHPELLARLAPVIDRFERDLEARSTQQTAELIAKAARQFDPADPASPVAQQSRLLAEQLQKQADTLVTNNADLGRKIDALTETVKLAQAASGARATAERMSTLKGKPFEDALHLVLAELAAGYGDEYVDTSATVGLFRSNKKGDGVLAVFGGDVRIVIEMTDSERKGWGGYLSEAERNRGARASLGIVRSADQLGGHGVVSLGPRRLLLAFDPETDSVDLLRVVLQLLRLAAQSAVRDERSGEVRVAEEKIAEAIGVIGRIDKVTKAVGIIRREATTIGDQSEALHTELSRLLSQARTALGAVSDAESSDAAA